MALALERSKSSVLQRTGFMRKMRTQCRKLEKPCVTESEKTYTLKSRKEYKSCTFHPQGFEDICHGMFKVWTTLGVYSLTSAFLLSPSATPFL